MFSLRAGSCLRVIWFVGFVLCGFVLCGLVWSVGFSNAHSRLKRREHTDFPQITRRYASRTVGEIRRPFSISNL